MRTFFKNTGKFIFISTYAFLLIFFLWKILIRPLIDEFIPLGPIYTDVAKRIESPDGTKQALLIRHNGWDLNFAVKIKEGLKTRTLHWTEDFVPDLGVDWNEKITWSEDSNLLALTVDKPSYKRYFTYGPGLGGGWIDEPNEEYVWAYDFKTGKEYSDKDIIMNMLNSKNIKDKTVESNIPSLEPSKAIDNEWSKWLVGQWQGTAKSDFGPHKDWVKGNCRLNIKLDLNNQFLVRKGEAFVTALSDEYVKQLKNQNLSDSDIEKIRNSTFESIEYYTIDAKTGEVIGYLFDSLGCVAEGKGRREANKETINWTWSARGGGTSVRTTEKISDDKFISTETYTLPDGSTMEDKVEMTRASD